MVPVSPLEGLENLPLSIVMEHLFQSLYAVDAPRAQLCLFVMGFAHAQ